MKTYYKNSTQKNNLLSWVKDLIEQYRNDNYIDEDTIFTVKYKDGSMLKYPEQVEQIKFKNIVNIWFSNADCYTMDFNNDFIGTQEDWNNMREYEDNRYPMQYKNPLIISDMDDYYKVFEA
jgi:hypothetical protein